MLAEQKQYYTPSEIEEIRARERRTEMKLVERTGQQRAVKAVMLGSLFLIFALCFLYVALETRIYNTGYAINSVRDGITAMEGKVERVALEVDSLSAMDRIEPLAMAIGMVYPQSGDKIYVAYNVAPPVVEESVQLASDEDIAIEVLNDTAETSLGNKVLQVLGSLFGGHFGIRAR